MTTANNSKGSVMTTANNSRGSVMIPRINATRRIGLTFEQFCGIVSTDRDTELQTWGIGQGRFAVIEHYGEDYRIIHVGDDRETALHIMRNVC